MVIIGQLILHEYLCNINIVLNTPIKKYCRLSQAVGYLRAFRGSLSSENKRSLTLTGFCTSSACADFWCFRFSQVCTRCILDIKTTSGHFHAFSVLVFLRMCIDKRPMTLLLLPMRVRIRRGL